MIYTVLLCAIECGIICECDSAVLSSDFICETIRNGIHLVLARAVEVGMIRIIYMIWVVEP